MPSDVRAPTPTHAGHHDAERRPAGQGPTYKEPTRGGGAGAPTEEDITQATLLANRRWLPTIVQQGLCYGRIHKKLGAGLWCRVCSTYVATLSIDAGSQEIVMDDLRDCPHYNKEVRQAQRDAHAAAMQSWD